MGAYFMVNKVILGYPTYGESHSPFYESYHRDNDIPLFSMWHYLFWGTISQNNLLQNVVSILKGLYFDRGVY